MATFCPSGTPAAAVLARETAHVQQVFAVASRHGVPVVPQGGRSGLSGGANAIDGCIVLSLERMDRIVEIDAANRIAVVEPGVLNADSLPRRCRARTVLPSRPLELGDLDDRGQPRDQRRRPVLCEVRRHSRLRAFAGGRPRHGRGAAHRTPDGQRGRGLRPHPAVRRLGGNPRRDHQATLALRPAGGEARTVAGLFPTVAAAGDAVARVVAGGQTPSLLEFMDQVSLRAANDYRNMGLPEHAAAMLIAQSDAGPDRAAADISATAAHFARRRRLRRRGGRGRRRRASCCSPHGEKRTTPSSGWAPVSSTTCAYP